DLFAILPVDSTLSSGVGTFAATLYTRDFLLLMATDTVSSSIYGASSYVKATGPLPRLSELTVPTSASGPYGITAGFPHSIWVTESFGNKIGELYLFSGVVTERDIPTSNSHPKGITMGADGEPYFAESSGNKIGRVKDYIEGVGISEAPIPSPSAAPLWITLGPDAAVYFTEQGPSKIGRLAPGGVVSEQPAEVALGGPYSIARGHDGRIYYTENGAQVVAFWNVLLGYGSYYDEGTNVTGVACGDDDDVWV